MSGLLKIASGIENDFYFNFFSGELKTLSPETGFFKRVIIQIVFGINNSRVDNAIKEIFKRETRLIAGLTKEGIPYKETEEMQEKRWAFIDRIRIGLESYTQRNNKSGVFIRTLYFLSITK